MAAAIKADLAFISFAQPSILGRESFLRDILIMHPELIDQLPECITKDARYPMIISRASASGNKISPPVMPRNELRKSLKMNTAELANAGII
jgi:hypothetical protein